MGREPAPIRGCLRERRSFRGSIDLIMVAIVVNAKKVSGTDQAAADAFQAFLLKPSTQARIAAFRYAGIDQQVWWPAGRHNNARE